jgi:hypothetical protein
MPQGEGENLEADEEQANREPFVPFVVRMNA